MWSVYGRRPYVCALDPLSFQTSQDPISSCLKCYLVSRPPPLALSKFTGGELSAPDLGCITLCYGLLHHHRHLPNLTLSTINLLTCANIDIHRKCVDSLNVSTNVILGSAAIPIGLTPSLHRTSFSCVALHSGKRCLYRTK